MSTITTHEAREDLERLREHEQAAKRAGFALAQPLFTLGTRVNALGVANFKKSRLAFEKLPPASEAFTSFRARIGAEDRLDSAPKRLRHDFHMSEHGLLVNGSGTNFALNKHSFRQLIMRTGFDEPGAAATYLAEIPPDRRAREVNALLAEAAEDATCVFRTRRQPGQEVTVPREAYAIVSEDYTTGLEVDTIALALGVAKWPGDARGSVVYDGQRASIKVEWHSDIQPERACAGEVFNAFAGFASQDDGGMGLDASSGCTRNLCLNLIILAEARKDLGRKRHTGDFLKLADFLSVAIEGAKHSVREFAETWDRARQMDLEIAEAIRDLPKELPRDAAARRPDVMRGIYRGLMKAGQLSLPGYRSDVAASMFTRSWEKEPEYTRAGVVNGITRAAHEVELRGLWSSETIEEQAGRILADRRPFTWAKEGAE